jgi:hypothetical protein
MRLQAGGTFLRSPGRLERVAVALLCGVGGDREWWYWTPRALVGHLRVPITPAENAYVPPGLASSDPGATGPERVRTP